MEIKEVERVVIMKPIASKPSFTSFRSFSELLAGAINASPPPNMCTETAMTPIRPKTIRVKPTANRASIVTFPSQGDPSVTDPVSKLPERKSSVVYKPMAKVVSKATVSLLASMGAPSITHQQVLAQIEARTQHYHSKLQAANKPVAYRNLSTFVPIQAEPPKRVPETVEDPKPYTASANVDRPSYDGYNWRKYGQKQVKGSEYPRSYYKCTHPNCPVKKKVERSFDGQIAEIVYKGEHSHPKPQPPKKSSGGVQETGYDTNNLKSSNNMSESNEGSEGRVENHGGVGLPTQSTYLKKSRLLSHDSISGGFLDDPCVRSGDCGGLEVDDDEPRNKRRKSVNLIMEAGKSMGEGIQEPRISVQNVAEPENVGDGFRWRKYGQKVVKGNPYPRSYYKCTSLKCSVRKHVERVSEGPGAFITTYEGKHNHDKPTRSTNIAASQLDPHAPSNYNKLS